MSADPTLEELQRWMQAVVLDPNDVARGLESIHARTATSLPLDRLLKPSSTLTAQQRLAIYHSMYLLRLKDALAIDYPGVLACLGDHAFTQFASEFVTAHPSRSYTLNRLGDRFPGFLALDHRPRYAGFLHQLARLELAITTVFDAEPSPVLTSEMIAEVPEARWPEARLRPIAGFQQLELDWQVSRYLDAVREHRKPPPVRRRREWVVVFRRGFAVRRLELDRTAHEMLGALVGGAPLSDAIGSHQGGRRPETLSRWFRDWVSAGLFQAVEF